MITAARAMLSNCQRLVLGGQFASNSYPILNEFIFQRNSINIQISKQFRTAPLYVPQVFKQVQVCRARLQHQQRNNKRNKRDAKNKKIQQRKKEKHATTKEYAKEQQRIALKQPAVHFLDQVHMEMKDKEGILIGFEDAEPNPTNQAWLEAVQKVVESGGSMEELRPLMPNVTNNEITIRTAEFISSSLSLNECPDAPEMTPEIAIIGASNVGKSSLINCLTSASGLARVSKRPGMTRAVNHYRINSRWHLVDMPGYGTAKAPAQIRKLWMTTITDYFLNRPNLAHVLLLVDALNPTNDDMSTSDWLAEHGVPYTVIFTKCDLYTPEQYMTDEVPGPVSEFLRAVQDKWNVVPFWYECSSMTGQGTLDILKHLAQVRKLFEQEKVEL